MKLTAKIINFFRMPIFARDVEAGDFLEHAQVHGDYYGTLREPVLTNLKNGVDVLIDIDTQGAAIIRNCDDPVIRQALTDVFIMPPDLDELRRRLRNAEPRPKSRSKRRLETAAREMELWRDYRYTIISESVEEDLEKFRHIMGCRKLFEPTFDPEIMRNQLPGGLVSRFPAWTLPASYEIRANVDLHGENFQTKIRTHERAKSGAHRGREEMCCARRHRIDRRV